MDRRVVGFLVVAALVGLGGCNGAFGPVGEDPVDGVTVTPAPVPTAGTTGTPARPGWIDSGRVDVAGLERAHRRALAGRSYTLVGRPTRADADAVNRTLAVETSSTYLVVAGNDTTYADPSGTYVREYRSYDDTYTVTTGPPSNLDRRQWAGVPFIYVTENVTRVTPVERDGERFYRLFFTGDRAPFDPRVVTYTATAYVTPAGFVETVVFTAELRQQQGRERLGYRLTYRDVGNTTVEAPAWVEHAGRNRTTPTPDHGA